ncbi:MAG: hypothetical protein COV59_01550 [Candidatus Magasanikbacteria bacterium CG11_big_fil_rev_8_21_14_0_20_39_34]|uniref:Thioredoxin domain-containing protein n=1 Tax=Candidatus Magasanikbacteria bacterium CG11_big_fil_rev_8_21_14_0_20_39_34 TaxID=1974653 RepID=A0A2H0N5X8_9BACT|nr:MAG: hypothetical protein COV59_01550 [Candidatus Magasanikbacteria bacterium CG11_big_fil_rev_8_21_14_0_20_39_34]
MPSNYPQTTEPSKNGGITPIIFIILLIVVPIFLLTLYYSWQIKQGKGADIVKELQNSQLSRSTKLQTTNSQKPVSSLKSFIKDYSPKKGSKDAKVTILAFIDFECPYSQESYATFQKVIEKYGKDTFIVFKNLPIDELHPDATTTALAASCANEQNAFWDYYNLLFTLKKFDSASLLGYANSLHLNTTEFQSCITNEKYLPQIQNDILDAINLGVQGTPTYFVNGIKIEGVYDLNTWDKVIMNELTKV